jgi:N-formylglutamate amidohydrolase
MILHIPHSSIYIGNAITLARPLENLFFLTDYLTDEIFAGKGEAIVFPYSRFVCDVERLENDFMSKIGQGIIYEKDTFGIRIVRHISDDLIMEMYREHHKKLNSAVRRGLTLLPKVVVVDCHSFPAEIDEYTHVCIGTDKDHTPTDLLDRVVDYFKRNKREVGVNTPYAGTIIPSDFVDNKDVLSIMIEINKSMYAFSKDNLEKVKSLISGALEVIYDYEFNS